MAKSRNQQSASIQRVGKRNRLQAYFSHHQWVATETLQQLLRQPMASALTWLVIAIALTLPGLLWVAVDNFSQLDDTTQASGSFTVYFDTGTPLSLVSKLEKQIQKEALVDRTQLISADDALTEFRQRSRLSEAIELLDSNPLPHVVIVEPLLSSSPQQVKALALRLQDLPNVAQVDIDDVWLQRLAALLSLAKKSVWLLSALLAMAIILVVGNTIRLIIANREDEIRVMRLVGATNRWIRRPFLYMGIWYGAMGALLSWVLLVGSWLLLEPSLSKLADLYGLDSLLQPIEVELFAYLLAIAVTLGWFGAFWSVRRHLGKLQATD